MLAKSSSLAHLQRISIPTLLSVATVAVFLGTPGLAQDYDQFDYISITTPAVDPNWDLDPRDNPNVWQGYLVVNASGPWSVAVSADPADGCMAEYNSSNSEYVTGGKKVQTPMRIRAVGGNEVDLSEGSVLIEGDGNLSVPVTFEQTVTWQDRPLHNGNAYHTEVSFIGSLRECIPPSIDSFYVTPSDGLVLPGDTAILRVNASGSDLNYQWLKYDDSGNLITLMDGGHISGADTSTLTIADLDCTDFHEDEPGLNDYFVNVSNSCGYIQELVGSLNPKPIPVSTQPAPSYFYDYYCILEVLRGEGVTFSVNLPNPGDYSYQWQMLQFNGEMGNWVNIAGNPTATTSSFSFTPTENEENLYRAQVTKGDCTYSSQEIDMYCGLSPLDDQYALNGATVKFDIWPADSDVYRYQWEVYNGATWSPTGSDSNELSFTALSGDDGKKYRVTATKRADVEVHETSNEAILRVGLSGPDDVKTSVDCWAAFFHVMPGDNQYYDYAWEISDDNGLTWSPAGSNSPWLDVINPQTSDSGKKYRVTVTGIETGQSETSRVATLTVDGPLTITTQPESQEVSSGGTATFSVDATGGGDLTYQWFKKIDSQITQLTDGGHISGATDKNLTISPVDSSDAADYYAQVMGSCYSMNSNTVTLTACSPPTITSQPRSQTVCMDGDSTASFSVDATCNGDLAYQWFKVIDNEIIELVDDGRISGATSNTFTLYGVDSTDAADYYVVVTGPSGLTATSNNATLTVNYVPVEVPVVADPSDHEVVPGDTATLSVGYEFGPGNDYQWYWHQGDPDICSFHGSTRLSNGGRISGANTSTLRISDWHCSDAGCYFVVVSNLCGWGVGSDWLGTKSPITTPPMEQWVLGGGTVAFSVEVDPPGEYSYQWQKSPDGSWDSWSDITGNPTATTSTLSLIATPEDDNSIIRVKITKGDCTWTSDEARLFVGLRGPDDQVILDWGDTVRFSVAPQDLQRFDYQWQMSSNEGGTWSHVGSNSYDYGFTTSFDDNGRMYRVKVTEESTGISETSREAVIHEGIVGPDDQIAGMCEGIAEAVSFTVHPKDSSKYHYSWYHSHDGGGSWDSYGDSDGPTLTVYVSNTDNNGTKWKVIITDQVTHLTRSSRAANLTVYRRPCIHTQPSSLTACPGGTATFNVDAAGDSLTYQWYKVTPYGTTDLTDGGRISGATTSTLTISSVESSDAADYYVVLRGLYDSVETSHNATLTMGPPSITGPVDQVVCPGSYAFFGVYTDENLNQYHYQWQRSTDGGGSWNDMSGETWWYYDFYATLSDSGNKYRCNVSDISTGCSAHSDEATLTVTTEPNLEITMEDNPDPVSPDGDLIYTIGYLNRGCTAFGAVVEVDYDYGSGNVQFVSSDPPPTIDNNTWFLGDLGRDQGGTIKIKVHVAPTPSSSSLFALAALTCDGGGRVEASNITEVNSGAPLLYIEKNASSQVIRPGDSFEYTINFENRGGSALTNVTVNDTIDKHVQFVAAYPSPDRIQTGEYGTHLWWSVASLGTQSLLPGDSRQMKIWTFMPYEPEHPEFDSIYNQYNISSDEMKGNSNTLQTFVVHSLYVRKKAEKQVYSPGEMVNYTILYGNDLAVDAENAVIRDTLPDSQYMEYLSADPSPDAIEGNSLIWNIGRINAGDSGGIQLYAQIRENCSEMNFKSSGFVSGEGFANIHQKLDTAQKPDRLTNVVNITANYLGVPDFDSSLATIRLADALGTEVDIQGHGSGTYRREDVTQMLTKNRSIQVKTSLSEVYGPTSFSLPKGRTLNYDSKWSEAQATKNRITGASTNERYMYATRINRESKIDLDKNGSTVASETSFEGAGHIGVLKKPGAEEQHKGIPTYESREDYLGSFTVSTYVDEYGKNLATNRTVSGRGMASSDRRISNKQRSYESGTGAYRAEERTDTLSNYMAKDLNASHEPVSYTYTPDVQLSLSKKWKEGMWSRSGSRNLKGSSNSGSASFISEEYSDTDSLNVSTVAPGLNEMDTEAEFSGKAEFKAAKETAGSASNGGENVALYDEYIGKYRISRKTVIPGVARFDVPHISISKVGSVESPEGSSGSDAGGRAGSSIVNYAITVENDGNRALGPVYITDLFPPGTKYVSSSSRPTKLAADHAVWTLLALGIGSSTQIELKLKVKEGTNGLVNRVQADGAYNDEWVTAGNFSAIQFNYLSCCPPQLLVTKSGYVDPLDARLIHYSIALESLRNSSMVATVNDWLPSGLVFLNSSVTPSNISSNTNEVDWNAVDLKPEENKTIYYDCRALWGGTFENMVHVEAYTIESADFTSNDVISSVRIEGEDYRSTSTWQPPSCFDLNCTAAPQGYSGDWVPCESCGASEPASLEPAPPAEQGCPSCNPSRGVDDDYDIP